MGSLNRMINKSDSGSNSEKKPTKNEPIATQQDPCILRILTSPVVMPESFAPVEVSVLPVEDLLKLQEAKFLDKMASLITNEKDLILKKRYGDANPPPLFEEHYDFTISKIYCSYLKQFVENGKNCNLGIKFLTERLDECLTKISDNLPFEIIDGLRKMKTREGVLKSLNDDVARLQNANKKRANRVKLLELENQKLQTELSRIRNSVLGALKASAIADEDDDEDDVEFDFEDDVFDSDSDSDEDEDEDEGTGSKFLSKFRQN